MKTKTLLFKINEELKNKFKAVCATKGETQQDELERIVKLYVDTNGNLTEKK